MERHCNSEMVSPFLTTCEATSPERKRVADFCLIELSTDILVSPYICARAREQVHGASAWGCSCARAREQVHGASAWG
eukprot:4467966-Prymnesium_polylepis.2